MAEQVVVNAAEIAAARAREAQRVNSLNKAQADADALKSSSTKLYGTTISPIVKSLTAATQQALKELNSKSGKVSKSTQAKVDKALADSKALQPTIKTQFADYSRFYLGFFHCIRRGSYKRWNFTRRRSRHLLQ